MNEDPTRPEINLAKMMGPRRRGIVLFSLRQEAAKKHETLSSLPSPFPSAGNASEINDVNDRAPPPEKPG